jgi:hypothetical protein
LLWLVTGVAFSIAEMMESHSVPGVSVAVINGFEIEWARGYGVREAGGTGAVTADTLFQTASVGKMVTAVTVLAVVERGLIDLLRSERVTQHHSLLHPQSVWRRSRRWKRTTAAATSIRNNPTRTPAWPQSKPLFRGSPPR